MQVLSPARANHSGDGESRAPLRRVAGPIRIFRWEMYIVQIRRWGSTHGRTIAVLQFQTDMGDSIGTGGRGKGERGPLLVSG